jgi:hypothetical protein
MSDVSNAQGIRGSYCSKCEYVVSAQFFSGVVSYVVRYLMAKDSRYRSSVPCQETL